MPEQVDSSWFEPANGWFSQGAEPNLEKEFLDETIAALGTDSAVIRAQLDKRSLKRL